MFILIQATERKMPAAIPLDIRKKIVSIHEKGKMTQVQIAEAFDITNVSVCKFVNKAKRGEDLTIKKSSGRPSRINETHLKILKDIVLANPDKTLMEYSHLFEDKTGLWISRSAMDRFIKKLNFRRKKKSLYAQEQDRPVIKKKEKILCPC